MKKQIAVIFGGRSAEHDVSIITAHLPIIQSLLATGKYDVWPVYIAKDGSWYCDQSMNDLAYFQRADLETELKKQKPVQISLTGGLTMIWPGFRPRAVEIDIAFPAMHGTYGEDGTLMGLLRLANIPFVGCDLAASAVAMDKVLTKRVTEPTGVPSVPYVWFDRHGWKTDETGIRQQIAERLRYPLFVKPVHLGSSIGITKAENAVELENALEVALHYDDKVIVEQGVSNLIEVTLPIMGNEEVQFAHIERPLATFFGFEEKYLNGGGKKGGGEGVNSSYSQIPADISPELSQRVLELGEKTYRAIGASGIARIDFLIDGASGEVFMNEVNTLPGSLYHHNWRQKGVSGVELVSKLVALAEERHAAQKELTRTFRSEILQKVNGAKARN